MRVAAKQYVFGQACIHFIMHDNTWHWLLKIFILIMLWLAFSLISRKFSGAESMVETLFAVLRLHIRLISNG